MGDVLVGSEMLCIAGWMGVKEASENFRLLLCLISHLERTTSPRGKRHEYSPRRFVLFILVLIPLDTPMIRRSTRTSPPRPIRILRIISRVHRSYMFRPHVAPAEALVAEWTSIRCRSEICGLRSGQPGSESVKV